MLSLSTYRASWEYVPLCYVDAYRWMCEQMERRGIPMDDRPPIWMWFRGNAGSFPPNCETGICLLSHNEIENGRDLIEVEVPIGLVLLSSYGKFRRLVNDSKELNESIFDYQVDETGGVQAVVPYLEGKWLIDQHRLSMAVSEMHFEPCLCVANS